MKTLQTFKTFNSALTAAEMNAVKGGYFSRNSYKVGSDTVYVMEWDTGESTGASIRMVDSGGNTVYTKNTLD